MNEEPGVQPMLQFDLQIEHAPFVAPTLHFFDAIAIAFGNAQFHETKRVFGKTRFAEAHPIAAPGGKIWNDLAIQKIEQR